MFDDWKWVEEVEPFVLREGKKYLIDCTSGFDEGAIHDKLCELFGGNWKNNTNWFNNEFIFRQYNGKIYLYFIYEGSVVYGGWDGEFLNPDTLDNYIYYGRYITMDDFLDIAVLG